MWKLLRVNQLKNNLIVVTGALLGISAAILVKLGNPANMGVCLACFLRDIAGALGLHQVEKLRYFRPEILGFILGAFIISSLRKDFRSEGGSSPILRFVIGMFVMFGALVFLGCPTRMTLRLAGGDPTAIVGLLGLIFGAFLGTQLLKQGFTLGRSQRLNNLNGFILPFLSGLLLLLVTIKPSFIYLTPTGHAPLLLSLLVGLIIGGLAQRSGLCFVGGFRNYLLVRDTYLLKGFFSVLVFAFLANFVLKQFSPGASPIAHKEILWNFLGLTVVGLGSVMLEGCPFRQVILAGRGNTDSALTVLGMIFAAGIAHNYLFVSNPQGTTLNGKIVTLTGLIILLVIALLNRQET